MHSIGDPALINPASLDTDKFSTGPHPQINSSMSQK